MHSELQRAIGQGYLMKVNAYKVQQRLLPLMNSKVPFRDVKVNYRQTVDITHYLKRAIVGHNSNNAAITRP